MQLAVDLLRNCRENHARCQGQGPLPKRVIFVGSPEDEHPRLHKSNGEEAHYAALSHCWGDKFAAVRTIKSTISTESLRTKSISLDSLPQTFRDAIVITRRLGLRYLWIDSLCILQDCEEDWHCHSESMRDIYMGATVTISADKATNCFGGIFESSNNGRTGRVVINPRGSKNPIYVRPTQLSIYKFQNATGSQGQKFMHHAPISDPLFRRAWSLQEWILSRRLLRFGSGGLTWECEHEVRCECHPGRSQPCFPPRLHEPQQEKRISELSRYDNRNNLLGNWLALIEHYSGREVTVGGDRLPALAGLAAAAAPFAQEIYLYGHWKGLRFHESLLWKSHRTCASLKPVHTRTVESRHAPTWSWPSITGQVTTSSNPCIRSDFRVLETHGYPATLSPSDTLNSEAYILAAGSTMELQIWKHEDPRHDLFEGDRYKSDLSRRVFASPLGRVQGQTFELALTVDVDAPGLEVAQGNVLTFLLAAKRTGLVLRKRLLGGEAAGYRYERVALFEILDEGNRLQWESRAIRKSLMIV
ncbi:heterokaryon incompatibility protein [Diplodia corticola]|uniref:Heterokaryon incompatibility protein n=1 Tax=Diplodia corticola TaxID=236234 RepID=A0A1J9RK98_9PEZI|nr:heterokaryon incompatibility protein [Diplodia corticola]OJD28943.1 heterokaryon incompatibility protein [Diplodia corticola]